MLMHSMASDAGLQSKGKEVDVLEQHQNRHGTMSRAPSQDRLSKFNDTPYGLAYATRNNSRANSIAASWLMETQLSHPSAARACAPRGTYKKEQDETCLGWYDEPTQEVLKYARLVLIREMVHNIGWPLDGKAAWKQPMREAVSEANVKFQASMSAPFLCQQLHTHEACRPTTNERGGMLCMATFLCVRR